MNQLTFRLMMMARSRSPYQLLSVEEQSFVDLLPSFQQLNVEEQSFVDLLPSFQQLNVEEQSFVDI